MQQYVILDFELAVYFKLMFNQLHNQIERTLYVKITVSIAFCSYFLFLLFLKISFQEF
jgi:hypothetical protein